MKDDVEESFLEVAKKLAVLNLENDSDAVNLVSALTHKVGKFVSFYLGSILDLNDEFIERSENQKRNRF